MRGPYSTPIKPLTGSLFHADQHFGSDMITAHRIEDAQNE